MAFDKILIHDHNVGAQDSADHPTDFIVVFDALFEQDGLDFNGEW